MQKNIENWLEEEKNVILIKKSLKFSILNWGNKILRQKCDKIKKYLIFLKILIKN